MYVHTLNSAYNEKNYAENLLHYRWLFVKGNVIVSVWGIFGVEIFLRYSRYFVKGNFVIGGVHAPHMKSMPPRMSPGALNTYNDDR